MSESDRIKINAKTSVVQINGLGQGGWMGCLCQVDEVREWGVQAWVQIPMQGAAYIRLNWNQFDYIGEARLILSEDEED